MFRGIFSLFLVLLPVLAMGQAKEIEYPEIEIGIVEQLNDTIPLDLTFVNINRDTVTLRQLIDKPTILSFVYFDCPSICGPMQMGIAEVIGKTDLKPGVDFQVLTISFNPADTPEKAVVKKSNYTTGLTDEARENWIYLTGSQDNIKSITDAVGYRFKPTGFDFAHPSAIIVVSPAGKITRYLYGVAFLPFDLKMAVIEAQKGLARPTVNKILEFCFSYDSDGRKYTLQVTRIVGSLTIFIALIILGVLVLKRKKKNR